MPTRVRPRGSIAAVEADGVTLKLAPNSPKSAMDGVPKFVEDGNITPDFYAVNTMQPPYQPSSNKPAPDGNPAYADPAAADHAAAAERNRPSAICSPPKACSWAWYAGAWQAALNGDQRPSPVPNFQFHHQPFNYFANFAPGTRQRAAASARRRSERRRIHQGDRHRQIAAGDVLQAAGQSQRACVATPTCSPAIEHIADVIAHLQKSPQWSAHAGDRHL